MSTTTTRPTTCVPGRRRFRPGSKAFPSRVEEPGPEAALFPCIRRRRRAVFHNEIIFQSSVTMIRSVIFYALFLRAANAARQIVVNPSPPPPGTPASLSSASSPSPPSASSFGRRAMCSASSRYVHTHEHKHMHARTETSLFPSLSPLPTPHSPPPHVPYTPHAPPTSRLQARPRATCQGWSSPSSSPGGPTPTGPLPTTPTSAAPWYVD